MPEEVLSDLERRIKRKRLELEIAEKELGSGNSSGDT